MIKHYSMYGDPPAWYLVIDTKTRMAFIQWRPESMDLEDHRRAIDELGSVLQMRLHELARNNNK